jgi:hypothetical protein
MSVAEMRMELAVRVRDLKVKIARSKMEIAFEEYLSEKEREELQEKWRAMLKDAIGRKFEGVLFAGDSITDCFALIAELEKSL